MKQKNRFLAITLLWVVAFFVSGCSASWHMKQACRKAPELCEEGAAFIDTLIQLPARSALFEFSGVPIDTVYNRIRFTYPVRDAAGVISSPDFVEVVCLTDTVRIVEQLECDCTGANARAYESGISKGRSEVWNQIKWYAGGLLVLLVVVVIARIIK